LQDIINLENLIKPFSIIKTKHAGGNDWVTTAVINSRGQFLEVKQVDEYLESVLMIGDKLECKIVEKNLIYLMNAEVYNVKFASRSIVLLVDTIQSIKNVRKHKRYDVYLSSCFCKKGEVCDNYCVVVNVSLEGLSIITRSKLKAGDIIDLNIYFKGFQLVSFECEIRWKSKSEQNYLYGLSIKNISEKSKALYRSFIKKLQRKERLLTKERLL